MAQYGIALAEVSDLDLEKFDIVAIPRNQMRTIVTKYGNPITDRSGQTEPVPCNWANGWVVQAVNWTAEHTNIINKGIADYNNKYPDNPISQDEVNKMIW